MPALEYPQDLAPDAIRDALENAFSQGTLKATGASYFEGQKYDAANPLPSGAAGDKEYELNGKRYVRIEATVDGHGFEKGKGYWCEVKPIEFGADGLGTKSPWAGKTKGTENPEPIVSCSPKFEPAVKVQSLTERGREYDWY